jgi:hypothetical protein
MSTDYYLLKNVCPHCGTPEKKIQIGTSSNGWCFGLHVMPYLGIRTLGDWVELFADSSSVIKDEYDDTVDAKEMLDIITRRSCHPSDGRDSRWYKKNHAIPGPNGLARQNIDGSHIIEHGEGTWDYIFDSDARKYEEW